jgi:Rad3-related DNA helicase
MSKPLTPRTLGLPFDSFRDGQSEIIRKLSTWQQPAQILNAPTGTGKTLVAISTALTNGHRVLYLTRTKRLQDAVAKTYNLANLKGRANYKCVMSTVGQPFYLQGYRTCDNAVCFQGVKCELQNSTKCLYNHAEHQARINPRGVVTNYAKWFALLSNRYQGKRGTYNQQPAWGKFDLIVCDEAHTLLDALTDTLVARIPHGESDRLLDLTPPETTCHDLIFNWAQRARNEAASRWGTIRRNGSINDLRALEELGRSLARIATRAESTIEQTDKHTTATPVWPRLFYATHLTSDIPRMLFMSATIRRQDILNLGCPNSDMSYHEVPSTFNTTRRPILYYAPDDAHIALNYRTSVDDWREITTRIENTVDAFPVMRALIHSVSFKRAKEITDAASDPSRFILSSSHNGVEQFNAYLNRPNSILVSPSIAEGVDLPDDLCRLICIPKIPFENPNDPLNKARKATDNSYLARRAADTVMQMAGRGMRSADDWVVIAIYDYNVCRIRQHFSPWFDDAFATTDKLPQPLGAKFADEPQTNTSTPDVETFPPHHPPK